MYRWNHKLIPNPPSVIKQKTVRTIAINFNLHHLVETGTYLGDMLQATNNIFSKIDSVELSTELYRDASKRFAKVPHIKIWNGDSTTVLPKIVDNASEPILFWLDAHYSGGKTARSILGDTPIEKELEIIFKKWNRKSVILIDDARLFIGKDNYPTINDLEILINKKIPSLCLKIENDIIILKDKNNSHEKDN